LQQKESNIQFNLYVVDSRGHIDVFSQAVSCDWTSRADVDGQQKWCWKDKSGYESENLDDLCQPYLKDFDISLKPGVPKKKAEPHSS
jgi:hypothetical protein